MIYQNSITQTATIFLLTLLLTWGCNPTAKNPIAAIEQAHNKSAFFNNDAVKFDIALTFGGKERLNGTITVATNSTKALIELTNGEKIYTNENEVYCTEGLKYNKKVRFDAFTWTYFFLLPYKLSDPGTQWAEFKDEELGGQTLNSGKLSFAAGTGDAPDDWYIIYSSKETNLINYSAYIVTANKSQEEAEKDPHAIEYSGYKKIEGIPISHEWKFWGWQQNKGLTEQLGSAEINNVQFVQGFTDSFSVLSGAIKR